MSDADSVRDALLEPVREAFHKHYDQARAGDAVAIEAIAKAIVKHYQDAKIAGKGWSGKRTGASDMRDVAIDLLNICTARDIAPPQGLVVALSHLLGSPMRLAGRWMTSAAAEAINTLTNSTEPMTAEDTADAIGKTVDATRDLMRELVELGEICQTSDGRYAVVKPNKSQLALITVARYFAAHPGASYQDAAKATGHAVNTIIAKKADPQFEAQVEICRLLAPKP